MFVRRISTIALLCALILAVPLVSQPQASGPRAELGPQATEAHPDYGAVEGKHYVNGYFGFSYAFPDGWKANAVQSSNAAASQYALLTANPESSGGADMRYITIVADPLPKNTTPKTFMDGALKSFASPEAGFEVLHADKHYTFGGKQFYRLDMVSKVAPGAPVFLWPESDSARRSLGGTKIVTADVDGHFLIQGLPPGNYRVVASFDVTEVDEDVLVESQAQTITVGKSARANAEVVLWIAP